MFALARALLSADAVGPDAMARALLEAATQGTSLARALLTAGVIDAGRLERHLARGHVPYTEHVSPVAELARSLPAGLCQRLLAVPVRRDPTTGTVDVAVVDARDPHAAEEMAYWLSAPVRVVQTSLASLGSALERLGAPPLAPSTQPGPVGDPGATPDPVARDPIREARDADGASDTQRLQEIARAAGVSLERILRRRPV